MLRSLNSILIFPRVRLLKLRNEVGRSLNRAGNKLWEEGDKESVKEKVFFAFDVATVYVDDIGERLEGVERYTDRQYQIECKGRCLHSEKTNKTVCGEGEEVEILVEEQDTQAYNKGQTEPEFTERFVLAFFNLPRGKIGNQGGQDNQKQ